MAIQRGFEPPTPGLGNLCSILLSYWINITKPPYIIIIYMKKINILLVVVLLFSVFSFAGCGSQTKPEDGKTPEVAFEKKDIKVGTGKTAENGDYVRIDFTAWIVGGEKDGDEYDSTRNGGLSDFTIGLKQVCEGLEMGVDGMKVGGKREIIVPSSLGNRDGNVLRYEITLLKVKKAK